MIIAVSMRVTSGVTYHEPRDAISHDWIEYLNAMPVTPVTVPNTLRSPSEFMQAIGARGLILTGGDDLGPLPGEVDDDVSPNNRDATERELLGYALANDLPVFGVCRGLHVINAYFGGTLERDLGPASPHVNSTHPVEIVSPPSELVRGISRVVTNSFHSQGVLLSGLAHELDAFALAHGEVVEGVRSRDGQVLAVQWHPERVNPAAELDQALTRDWLARCE
jgi:putative glutamine amidotransferase